VSALPCKRKRNCKLSAEEKESMAKFMQKRRIVVESLPPYAD